MAGAGVFFGARGRFFGARGRFFGARGRFQCVHCPEVFTVESHGTRLVALRQGHPKECHAYDAHRLLHLRIKVAVHPRLHQARVHPNLQPDWHNLVHKQLPKGQRSANAHAPHRQRTQGFPQAYMRWTVVYIMSPPRATPSLRPRGSRTSWCDH